MAHDPSCTWPLTFADEASTLDFARSLAGDLKEGDLVTLSGDLGSGKTTFARSLIRELAHDPSLEVPSPTFTLVQFYDTPRGNVLHADLFRIGHATELEGIGFNEVAEDAIVLVEWPEQAEDALYPDRLNIAFHPAAARGPEHRMLVLTGSGSWGPRLRRMKGLRELLSVTGWLDARRHHLQGDASARAYERLEKPDGSTAILMISPKRPDGPPIRRGQSYSAIAKLAESVHAFVAMDHGLRSLDLSAPAILGQDLEAGLLLLEDLGANTVVGDNSPIPERYAEATRLLAELHSTHLPFILPVEDGVDHVLPTYDMEALLIEAELLIDWYVPHKMGVALAQSIRMDFTGGWNRALSGVVNEPPTWTLRDYHSPNLLWLEDREGIARIGLLDFQDCALGHPAYDLVSLLQDARVTVPPDLEIKLLGLYARLRQERQPEFNVKDFARAYALLGAQRATKILGIFARLDRRDGKPQYLAHLPRVEAYLKRNLTHAVLGSLKVWYEKYVSVIFETDTEA